MGLDYEICYKKGKDNLAADALSRLPEKFSVEEFIEITTLQQVWLSGVVESYQGDSEAQAIISGIITQDDAFKSYQYAKGLMKVTDKVYVGETGDIRNKILWECHDSPYGGHSGQEVTFRKASQFFFWPGMRKAINDYVASCDVCQRIKSGTKFPGGLLQPLPIPNQIWEDISLDFIEGLPKSGDKDCILVVVVVVDRFTKVGHFISISHPYTATQVAQAFFDTVYRLHGMAKTVVSDRDRIFTSSFWKELFSASGTKLQINTAYLPQSDGQTERLNRCLEQYLRAMVSHRPKHWCKWLPLTEWWYNSSYNSAIRMTPFEALYGVKPQQFCIPADCRTTNATVEDFQVKREAMNTLLQTVIQQAQQKYKFYADKKRTEAEFQIEDWVFLKLQPYKQVSVAVRRYLKLSHKYFGPYLITDKVGPVAYKLQLPTGSLVHPVFHISLLNKKVGSKYTVTIELPKLGPEGQFLVYPYKLLQRRSVKKNNRTIMQWLIQ